MNQKKPYLSLLEMGMDILSNLLIDIITIIVIVILSICLSSFFEVKSPPLENVEKIDGRLIWSDY